MGQRFLDKFSLLHFAWGIILYFFNVSLPISTLISILFELIENSDIGIKFIQTYIIGIWPGGKDRADSVYNQVGDVIKSFRALYKSWELVLSVFPKKVSIFDRFLIFYYF